MTYKEALKVPALEIHPTGLMEDYFFLRLHQRGELSPDTQQSINAIQARVEKRKTEDPTYSFICSHIADMMIDNLDRYGHPCIAWWPKD